MPVDALVFDQVARVRRPLPTREVRPRDPIVLGIVVLVLTFVAAIASLVPARRATRIDPLVSLRSD